MTPGADKRYPKGERGDMQGANPCPPKGPHPEAPKGEGRPSFDEPCAGH